MPTWTPESIAALAPDASSLAAGRSLATDRTWSQLGQSERAIWGLCQGSGKEPYQARIELGEPAFKCSCPSRKFPCKHGLGLLLLFAKSAASFSVGPEPGWVAEWLASRQERAEKRAERSEAAAKPVDVEAQAKRSAQRQGRVLDGVAGCTVWLEDLIRRGLAAAQVESGSFWQNAAARMVDAQAPGLATFIRRIPPTIASGEGWERRTLELLGNLHLLLTAATRLETLPPELANDVRTALGFTQEKEQALGGEVVRDRWVTVGQFCEEDDRIKVRRTWLIGLATGRRGLLLDFAVGNQPFEQGLIPATEFDGELAFYPSRAPLRALVVQRGATSELGPRLREVADESLDAGLHRYALALAGNPWLARWPLVLRDARLGQLGTTWHIVDRAGRSVPLRPSFAASDWIWRLLAVTAGSPCTLSMEWDSDTALPIGILERPNAGPCELMTRGAA